MFITEMYLKMIISLMRMFEKNGFFWGVYKQTESMSTNIIIDSVEHQTTATFN